MSFDRMRIRDAKSGTGQHAVLRQPAYGDVLGYEAQSGPGLFVMVGTFAPGWVVWALVTFEGEARALVLKGLTGFWLWTGIGMARGELHRVRRGATEPMVADRGRVWPWAWCAWRRSGWPPRQPTSTVGQWGRRRPAWARW